MHRATSQFPIKTQIDFRKRGKSMASNKEYLEFILEQLSWLEEITYRPMMGEYIIYYCGKIAAYVCDDRLLIKPTKSAAEYMRETVYEKPYDGAKDMLLADNVDDKEYLTGLLKLCMTNYPNAR